ncbi:MAG: PVC-type heme-binding CxxCH protein [Pirellulaceae bacterium]
MLSCIRGHCLRTLGLWVVGIVIGGAPALLAQEVKAPFIPRKQTQPPGPPLSPQEAIRRMKVPDGFTVELVASEPDIQNPVAMTFDERGRIWITESFEYPRKEAGPGRDRVKVLEDTNGDGKADKVTVFAEGLNIPSGIAVGYGGVWVANAPDILFLRDTDGDGKADQREVVVTGFGRTDTHELPNSLTWGPDGYLYGLNGVFNHSHVEHRGRKFDFTCALFRIHPKTRDFELFAEGTSNPWGIAWDPEGSAFVSACVIDHLWHLSETGYYLRQGGPYPPFTWHIGSIVKHQHQLAAYCGIHYFDSDAYPAEFRDRLYMGNIHGGCINVDILRRDGSTYASEEAPDFLTANDVWFMPVVQKTGPDGCLYILDWYDRYHCYQDANADPAGVDRGHGRLYRVRYRDTPRAPAFDLARESSDELIERLRSPNVFYRDIAQRLLTERMDDVLRSRLEAVVLDDRAGPKTRMHALWSLVGSGKLSLPFHQQLLAHGNSSLRAWSVRAAGNYRQVDESIRRRVVELARDTSPDVQLQVAIAANKLDAIDPLPVLVDVLAHSGSDKLIPHIVWQNLHPLLATRGKEFLAEVRKHELQQSPNLKAILPRATERMLAAQRP